MSVKEEAKKTAIIVFSVLLIFVPVTVWEHGCNLESSDIFRIICVPFIWYFLDVFVWPRIFGKRRKY